MATLLWRRDIAGDVNGVETTFSSWDACMSKAYCKWPVIIAIIVGSLIALSVIWCVARCLCCGLECCCGCLKCCNACCPSPRKGNRDQGYQQAPPTPYQNPPNPYHNQYHSSPAPVYASGGNGYRGANVPQFATFDVPRKGGEKVNEDALPAMPSWGAATSKKEEVYDDVELEKMDHHDEHQSPQQETLLGQQESGRYYGGGASGSRQELDHSGDVGHMNANPYHDYQQHQQFSPSPYGSQSHGLSSPYSTVQDQQVPYGQANAGYFNGNQQQPQRQQQSPYGQSNSGFFNGSQQQPQEQHYGGVQSSYESSIPPSYHTRAPTEAASPTSPQARSSPQYPGQQTYQAYGSVERKPVQGSWREV